MLNDQNGDEVIPQRLQIPLSAPPLHNCRLNPPHHCTVSGHCSRRPRHQNPPLICNHIIRSETIARNKIGSLVVLKPEDEQRIAESSLKEIACISILKAVVYTTTY
ncbi:hypothetical protein L1987_71328 [Smallanthus sonchifolius]|uniref:Uncharacterized protein n=1 Tax=Smallanthus sonchifolius TaxID=185202 RepID=A0ACB9ASR2_9ASTR|nr:hypothetical protein L1987_71328 [Smallanthus sonchifolius]